MAYSNEKPGVPTETPGCKTNPLTFEVIKGVVVICLWPATPADCFFTYFCMRVIFPNSRSTSPCTNQYHKDDFNRMQG